MSSVGYGKKVLEHLTGHLITTRTAKQINLFFPDTVSFTKWGT